MALVFASLALISGFFLWRTSRSALRLCNLLFGAQLVYWVGGAMLDVMLATSKSEWAHRLVTSLASVGGIGNMGLAQQVLSLYPVWALLLLNLADRRGGPWETPKAKVGGSPLGLCCFPGCMGNLRDTTGQQETFPHDPC